MAFGPALRAATAKIPPLILPAGAFAVGVCLLWPFPQRAYAFHYLVGESSFPVEVVNFIELNEVSGRVFSDYGWGGYLHHRTAGQMSVYIDGRANAVFDEETYLNYLKVYSQSAGLGGDCREVGCRLLPLARYRGRSGQAFIEDGALEDLLWRRGLDSSGAEDS